ncbi:MAG: Flp family type IVb pilin [Proteobacteria bacterium]|nr:MAG: Flp family type IVb pilin [Pseudomonadota bacterium]
MFTKNQNPTSSRTPATRYSIRNERGQGLIEYLVIVALMGVATIAIVRTMGAVVSSRFASVSAALQGQELKGGSKVRVNKSAYEKRDLGNFFEGAETDSKSGSGAGRNNVSAE